jgi:hypothetical protein
MRAATVVALPRGFKATRGTVPGTNLQVVYNFERARTKRGQDRLWIAVTQVGAKTKPWRMVSVLGYTRSAKRRFAE